MHPTLEPGDYVLGRRDAPLRRFDLVAFEHPARPGFWMVKRVLALGGEAIDLDAGTVDGAPLDDPFRDELVESGRWDVPQEAMFVLSDARSATAADSRTLGPIPRAGAHVLWLRYWPRQAIGRLRPPSRRRR